jgi:NAD(P)-dependent dehydrogenase (short-subunit alcohol dehydrogenase family)
VRSPIFRILSRGSIVHRESRDEPPTAERERLEVDDRSTQREEVSDMEPLKDCRIVVTGGSRGLGLGIVEALVAQQARVTVVARDATRLAEVSRRLGVATIAGDVTDADLARQVVREVEPSVLVLNAGAIPGLGTLDQMTWEDFERPWQIDVKASFNWLRAAIALPLPRGSRVILGSSGAAVKGSPLSGGYAGAKRMQWLMAHYVNDTLGRALGIHCQAIVPMQMIGETDLGRTAAEAYAQRRGVTTEAFLAGFGPPLPPRKVGEHVVEILTDAQYANGVAFGLRGDAGILSLDS